jgi:hypothetical protein
METFQTRKAIGFTGTAVKLPEPQFLTTQHILTDRCWVCGKQFAESGGVVDVHRHDHHIVPRAYGGDGGPQVSLCEPHHGAAHKIADKLFTQGNYTTFLTTNQESNRRLLLLATVIVNAKVSCKSDPNKPTTVHFVIDGTTRVKLNRLKRVYREATPALVLRAIHALYNRHFKS